MREHEGERDEGGFVSESRSSPANFVLFTVREEGPFLVFLLGFLPFLSSLLSHRSGCSLLRLLSIQEIIARSRALGNRSCGSFTDCAVIGSLRLRFLSQRIAVGIFLCLKRNIVVAFNRTYERAQELRELDISQVALTMKLYLNFSKMMIQVSHI